MLTNYILSALKNAQFETLDDGTCYWSVPWFKGVWANEKTKTACKKQLQEVLEEWIVLKIRKKLFIPTVEEYDLNKLLCES